MKKRNAVGDQTGEGGEVDQGTIVRDYGEWESKAIHKHLDKAHKFFAGQLNKFHASKSFRNVVRRPVTIKELSNISIALDLLRIYYGKQFTIRRTEFAIDFDKKYFDDVASIEKNYKLVRLSKTNRDIKNRVYFSVNSEWFKDLQNCFKELNVKLWVVQNEYETHLLTKEFIPEGAYNADEGYGLKYYLIELLGSFLLNVNIMAGYKVYDYDVLNEKIISLRKSIVENGLFLCMNIRWREKELHFRNILLLDILHFISTESTKMDFFNNEIASLNKAYEKANFKHSLYQSNLEYFKQELCVKYLKNRSSFSKDKASSTKVIQCSELGELIYSKEIGFGFLQGIGKDYLSIEKPGFKWDNEIGANVLKLGYPFSQIKRC